MRKTFAITVSTAVLVAASTAARAAQELPFKVEQNWWLHLCGKADLQGRLARTVQGEGTLFCRTLLPADARIELRADAGGHKSGRKSLLVRPADDSQRKLDYLHILYACDTPGAAMPKTSFKRDGARITVTVGALTHTFED